MQKRIYKVSEEDYAALAFEIKKRLLSPCYFTGVVETESATGEALRLTASLILYRHAHPSGGCYNFYDSIYDVSAVWWDFLCEDEDGIVWDDFDFERLKKALMEEE